MGELVTTSELEALREVVELGMQTTISILREESIPVEDGDDQQVWATEEITKGWIFEPPAFSRGNVIGGVQGEVHEFRLFAPMGTDIQVGDRIGVEGQIFNVTDTNDTNTYQTELRASLRKVE